MVVCPAYRVGFTPIAVCCVRVCCTNSVGVLMQGARVQTHPSKLPYRLGSAGVFGRTLVRPQGYGRGQSHVGCVIRVYAGSSCVGAVQDDAWGCTALNGINVILNCVCKGVALGIPQARTAYQNIVHGLKFGNLFSSVRGHSAPGTRHTPLYV